ncbi:acyl-coenzyme A thioesterase PaaI-like protein [Alloalcanivorax xenomutans]|uniref:PaaI family thioesterase n=1 Tax=Alloalcanivorax xenomutans TaxID=1094342 RepID=UPI000BD841E1|nr:PaaI family thioesterase [Alloalcanivorax xenomutans]SOC03989.1 acyl-coenzyme A thioesterase PaaI-like protein [Alloalcanivorax xenomutans]
MTEEKYHYFDMPICELPEPTPVSARRRELARELAAINEQLVRLDVDEAALMAATEQARALRESLEGYSHRSMRDILGRLISGQGNRQDALDMADFEILSGPANAMSPPVTFWLDGDVVRARATFGRAFMGPPGKVHGGVLSLALDMLLAKTQDFVTSLGMTGTLNVRYMAPTPLHREVNFEARLVRLQGRKLFNEARVFVDGVQTVAASGIWISSQGDYRLRPEYAHLANGSDVA